jgi:hypothetical protein
MRGSDVRARSGDRGREADGSIALDARVYHSPAWR